MKAFLFITLQRLLPQHFLSRIVGRLADWRAPAFLLQPFLRYVVRKFGIDMSIARRQELRVYKGFNEFFIRRLVASARPIGEGIVSPADGCISQLGQIVDGQIFQAKGHYYTTNELLTSECDFKGELQNGHFATIYLSPKDYHRVHMPCDGKLLYSIYVPGKLFSVNPTTVENIDGVFANNERLVNVFQTEYGPMAVVLVGAMLVAGIQTVWQGKITPNKLGQIKRWDYHQQEITFRKGDELGHFNFGSTVILLLPKDAPNLLEKWQASDVVQMGQTLADGKKSAFTPLREK